MQRRGIFVWWSVMWLACSFVDAGCLRTTREHLFAGRAVTLVSATGGAAETNSPSDSLKTAEPIKATRQDAESISVQGWVATDTQGKSLLLTFSNQSATAIPMSSIVDEYTAKMADGRVVSLKDGDFMHYPDILKPGDERTVTLTLPSALPVEEITQVVAKLNQGKAVVVLNAIGPKEPPAWRAGQASGIVVSEQARAIRIDPAQSPVQHPPEVLEPVGPVAPRSEAPVGTVPVIVEFHQALGSTLRAEVYWNDAKEHVTLATGDRQLFYVVPGQHELHVISRLPFIIETHARVPVVISATNPIRIDLNAQAKLTGVEIRVRVWHGNHLAVDQTFAPISR